MVESIKIITEKASTRICQFAFDYAARHERKKVSGGEGRGEGRH